MAMQELIDNYLAGPARLREAIAGMTPGEIDAAPIAGKWSTRQVICHLADFEPVYADRIKRILAEEEPTLFSGDPDVFAARLAYAERDIEEELQLIEAVRRHVGRILRTLPDAAFERIGRHSQNGPMTLTRIVTNIANHIPHHLPFIAEKRAALAAAKSTT